MPKCFLKDLYHFTFWSAMCENFYFSIFLSALIICLYYSHPSECEVVPHVVLICISLLASDVECLFICLLHICISSLKQCLFRSLSHFFLIPLSIFLKWIIVLLTHSGYQPFIRYMIHQYFIPWCVLSFYFFDDIVCSTKLWILTKPDLSFFFSSVAYAFGVIPKVCLTPGHKGKLIIFVRIWYFQPLCLGLWSILRYFCIWFREGVQLHSPAYGYPVVPLPCVKKTIFFYHIELS